MNKVIITGANGFIGSSLVSKLIKKGVRVVAIDRCLEPCHLPESDLITKIEIDLKQIRALVTMIAKDDYDAFYHFAWRGVNGTEKADPTVQLENAQITMECASVAQQIGCKKFLCAGTIAEQAIHSLEKLAKTSGGMMYGVAKYCTHLMLEAYCKNIGMDFVWMQFSNIYGPENKTGNLVSYTLGELTSGREAVFGPALQPYDFIYVDDLIEAVYRIGEVHNSQNCYYIGSGKPRILKDFLFEIGKIFGKDNLIKVGVRQDDGIVYTMEMFDTSSLIKDIGEYVSRDFAEGIKHTIANY